MGTGSSRKTSTISANGLNGGRTGNNGRAANGGGASSSPVVWEDAPEIPTARQRQMEAEERAMANATDDEDESEDDGDGGDDDEIGTYADRLLRKLMAQKEAAEEEAASARRAQQTEEPAQPNPPAASNTASGSSHSLSSVRAGQRERRANHTQQTLSPPARAIEAAAPREAARPQRSARLGPRAEHKGSNPTAAQSSQSQQQQQNSPRQSDEVLRQFVTASGEEFMVHSAEDGKLYFVNWDTQEWTLLPETLLEGGHFAEETRHGDNQRQDTSAGQSQVEQQKQAAAKDSRSGTFDHPKHGKFLTHLFEMKLNVLCFLDEQSGEWVRMPPAWEMAIPTINRLITNIKRMLPYWSNDLDVLTWLRSMNYNSENVISDFLAADVYGGTQVEKVSADPTNNRSSVGLAMEAEPVVEEKPMETMSRLIQGLQENLERRVSDLAAVSQESGRMKERISYIQLELDNSKKEVDRLQEENINFRVEMETLHYDAQSLKKQLAQANKQLTLAEDQVVELRKQTFAPNQLLEQHQELLAVAKVAVAKGGSKPSLSSISVETVQEICVTARAVNADARDLRRVIVREFAGLSALMHKATTHLGIVEHRALNFDTELEKMRTLYMREFMHRKQLYNQIQEMRGNIRVFCRCRRDDRAATALQFPADGEVQLTTAQGVLKKFEFEKVFGPASTQVEVFEDTLPIITSCVDGYNVCLMAYGQTGAGKTYTMMGTDQDPGINIRALSELLRICKERKQVSYSFKVSMLEVYNETLVDLLQDARQPTHHGKLVIQRKGKGICVPGLLEVPVSSVEDVKYLMETGGKNRTVAMTAMNTSSSRSHLMLKLLVDGVDTVSKATTHGSLMLLDLAGSERISKSEATGKRLVEAAAINKSLSALGQVFTALRQSSLHIPYRNSKLTHLLQPALGGDSKACMFVNVSPRADNIMETFSTLQFGASARQVALGEAKKNVM